MAEQILFEFQADYSQLQPAIDLLEKTGQVESNLAADFKKTNTEIAKQSELLKKDQQAAKGLSTNLSSLSKDAKSFSKALLEGIDEGFNEALQQAGVSVEDFQAALKELAGTGSITKEMYEELTAENKKLAEQLDKTNKRLDDLTKKGKGAGDGADSARARLKLMREELLNLADQGLENSERFQQLQKEAGELADSIGDVQARINAAGSDTAVFDGLISAASGLTGAFAVAQGAAALLGEENEDMQKTLLKVNAAMAVLQGLQQVQQVLQKESAASLLLLNTQRKIEVVQTNLATAAESKNIVVRGLATVAQKALNAVMSANPIGIVITALVAISAALVYFTSNAKKAAEEQGNLNAALSSASELLDTELEGFENRNKKVISDLQTQGAKESAIIKTNLENRKLVIESREREIQRLRKTITESTNADTKEANEKLKQLESDNAKDRVDIYVSENELKQQLRKEDEDARKKTEEDRRKKEEELAQQRAKNIADEQKRLSQVIAGYQLEQLELSETSDRWKELQKNINDTEAQIQLLTEAGKRAELILAQTAIANAKLFAKVSEDKEAALAGDVDIEKQFAVEAAKETERIEKESNAAKQKEFFDLMAARTKVIVEFDNNNKKSYEEFLKGVSDKAQVIANVYSQISNSLNAITAERDKAVQIQMDNDRKAVEEKLRLGQITEKEATLQQERIAQRERILKTKQAQRDKQLAIFNAIIGTAQAMVQALSMQPPPLGIAFAAIVGAMGAAQIAAISARPIPRFAKGKGPHDKYEGPGYVGEAGTELIVSPDGSMSVAKKKTLTWLGKDDQVLTHLQTQKILQPTTQIVKEKSATTREVIDYDKLASALAKKMQPGVNININKDFVSESIAEGLSRKNYFDKYYTFKR